MTESALFDGHLMHLRQRPIRRFFRYRVFTWLIDLDELPRLSKRLRFFAHNGRALVSINSRDHLGDPQRSIKANVLAYLERNGETLEGGGKILMLTNARVLGYVFDPLTVFYCHDRSGELRCVVAEVHNTFGERHCYLMHPDAQQRSQHAKEFHVSPFFAMHGRYRMRLAAPGQSLRAEILLDQDGREIFRAVLTGDRLPLTTTNVVRMLIKHPLLTHRITALIHWHAFENLCRRVQFHRHPHHVPQEGVG